MPLMTSILVSKIPTGRNFLSIESFFQGSVAKDLPSDGFSSVTTAVYVTPSTPFWERHCQYTPDKSQKRNA